MNMKFQRGDIVVSAPAYTSACYCILELRPQSAKYPYSALNLVNLETYQIQDDGLTKVGTATEEFLRGQTSTGTEREAPAAELRYRRGQARAAREAWHATENDRKRWLILASAEPGDGINIGYQCGHATPYRFRYVLERGSKYVFVAENPQGTAVKLTLNAISLEQVAPDVSLLGDVRMSDHGST
jgi:hypothetical protein